jgi:hypothetical protein
MKSMPAFALLLSLCAIFPFGEMGMAEEPAKPAEGETVAPVKAADPEVLTPEEKAEKDARQACKVDLCRAFRAKVAAGNDIACHVIKSWRKEQLVKLVSKLKVTWPYEGAHCSTDLSVKRGELIKAMSEPKVEIDFEKHTVSCSIAKDKSASTDFTFELAPKVTFENGVATKAQANWGPISAPTLIKSALWTATAADNTVNLLSSTIVDEVNDFIGKRCDEVKDQWAAKQ